MTYTIVSVSHYEIEADSYEEAIEKAMDGDYRMKDEEFPDVDGKEDF